MVTTLLFFFLCGAWYWSIGFAFPSASLQPPLLHVSWGWANASDFSVGASLLSVVPFFANASDSYTE